MSWSASRGRAAVLAARAVGCAVVATAGAARRGALRDADFGVDAPEDGAANVRAGAGGAAFASGSALAGTMAIRGATCGPSGEGDGGTSSVLLEAAAGSGAGAGAGGTLVRATCGAGTGAARTGSSVEPRPSGGSGEGFANHKPLARKDTAAKATAVATAVRRNVAGTRRGNVATFSLSIRQMAAAVASPPAIPGRMRKSSCRRRPSIASLRSAETEPGEGIPSTRHSPLITGPRQGARPRAPRSRGAAAAQRPRLRKTTSVAHRLLRPLVA
jgi:hypothetical protein